MVFKLEEDFTKINKLLDDLNANDSHRKAVFKSLSVASPEKFEFVKNLVAITHSPKHYNFSIELLKVFEIKHPRDCHFKCKNNCKLLFHGSPSENIYSILRDGYRHSLASENGNFYKGVYFSDCSSKAAIYTSKLATKSPARADHGTISPEFYQLKYMFLSEVSVGTAREFEEIPAIKSIPKLLDGKDSVCGLGRYQPKSSTKINLEDEHVIEVPNAELHKINNHSFFRHNEVCVFHSNQVKHKFLLVVKFLPQ